MKFRTTTKAIKSSGRDLIYTGYCDLADLLRYESPIAYTCGVCGWNYDIYEIEGILICTGYRGMPGKRAKNVRDYNEKARAVVHNPDAVSRLLHKFIELQKKEVLN